VAVNVSWPLVVDVEKKMNNKAKVKFTMLCLQKMGGGDKMFHYLKFPIVLVNV
jgi:hypothetical protein